MNSTRTPHFCLTLSLLVSFAAGQTSTLAFGAAGQTSTLVFGVAGQNSTLAFGAAVDAASGGINARDYGVVGSGVYGAVPDRPSGGVLLADGTATAPENGSTKPLPRGPNGELPAVLDPDKYSGQARAGYAACKEVPQICDKLFCYCGCDLTDCHGSLLDCFTNDHGEDCHICQEEAIVALKLHKKGKTLTAIQKEVDKKFEKEYPFEVESPALQKYKANRLWDMGKKKAPSGKLGTIQSGEGASADPGAADPNSPKRKLKPDGSCCAGKD